MPPRPAPSAARAEVGTPGTVDPELRAAYEVCRQLFARHGRTYYLATRLLPAQRRPAVHALYGFARLADDIVDEAGAAGADVVRARLDALAADLRTATAGAPAAHPVVAALVDTATRYRIDHRLFTDFLVAMRMDTEVTAYATFDDLGRYMHGSAEVIGLQMLPVLGTVVPVEEAAGPAAALGTAFQLTNFLRDVGEDLDRGRVYLPADELAAFGVDADLLRWCRRAGRVDPRVRGAMAHLVEHTRGVYRTAEPGIAMLEPVARACVQVAYTLYSRILVEVEEAGYPLDRRVVVSRTRRLAVAGPGLVRAVAARVGTLRRPSAGRGA